VRARRVDAFGDEAIVGWIVESRYLLEIFGANIDCASVHEPGPSARIRSSAIVRRRQISCTLWPRLVPGDCDANRRDLRARGAHEFRPIGKQLELFCYRLERLTCFRIDPCQRKGAILLFKGQIVACSLPGGIILAVMGLWMKRVSDLASCAGSIRT